MDYKEQLKEDKKILEENQISTFDIKAENEEDYEMVECPTIKNHCFGFNQDDLYNYGLSINDAYVLRWFIDFTTNPKMEKILIDGEIYYWVEYKAVMEQLPLLRITDRKGIQRIFNRLQECNILKQFTKHSKVNPHTGKVKGGKYIYYAFDENCFPLTMAKPKKMIKRVIKKDSMGQKSLMPKNQEKMPVEDSMGQKSLMGMGQKSLMGMGQKCPVKDTTVIDTTVIDTTVNIINNNSEVIEEKKSLNLFEQIKAKSKTIEEEKDLKTFKEKYLGKQSRGVIDHELANPLDMEQPENQYKLWLQQFIMRNDLSYHIKVDNVYGKRLIEDMLMRNIPLSELNEIEMFMSNQHFENPNHCLKYFHQCVKNGFKVNSKGKTNKELKTANFTQREYDYESLEKQLLGWE